MGIFFKDETHFPESFHEVSDFTEDWSFEEKTEVFQMLKRMNEHFSNYHPPKGVDIKDVAPDADESNSEYHGRGERGSKDFNAAMDINKSRRMESTAHELGHDIEQYFFDYENYSKMDKFTFKEFFADLNALNFTDAEPGDRELGRTPYRPKYSDSFGKARDAVDPSKRRSEIQTFNELISSVEDENYDELNESLELCGAPPYLSEENPRQTGSEMLVDALNDLDELRDLKKDIWLENKLIREGSSNEIGEFLAERMGERKQKFSFAPRLSEICSSLFGGYNRDLLRDNGQEVVVSMLENDLNNAREISQTHLDWIETGIGQKDIFKELMHLGYGDDEYDFHISLPHEVGGSAAEKQYKEGLRPVELVYAREEWMGYLNQELQNTIGNIYKV
jgi:hypothetical protein